MFSARHLGTTTAISAIAFAFGLNAAAVAAPTTAAHRVVTNTHVRALASRSVSVLHNFAGTDGASPTGSLDLDLGLSRSGITRTLYGVALGGGSDSVGTIYSFTLGPNVLSTLYTFTNGNDGANPSEGLANNDTNYFSNFILGGLQLGVTIDGGAGGDGTVYAVSPSGALTVIHAFTGGTDGGGPAGRLTRSVDGNFYGTTSSGGTYGYGTIYRITPSGAFSTVYSFSGGTDGASPEAGLAVSVNLGGHFTQLSTALEQAAAASPQWATAYLYGTTTASATGQGTIFRFAPRTGKLQTLYTFTGGADGAAPEAKLTTDFRGNLYGTTFAGGSQGNGVVFKLAANSTTPQVIYDFGDGTTGANPQAQLTFGFNGNLYGTTETGGAAGNGTVFEISGGTFADIHDFQGPEGANPQGALVDGGDGNLYGDALSGGLFSDGVLFSIPE